MTQILTLYLKTGTKDAANLKKAKELCFIFPIASSNHNYRPSCVSQKKSQIPGLEGEDVSLCCDY